MANGECMPQRDIQGVIQQVMIFASVIFTYLW